MRAPPYGDIVNVVVSRPGLPPSDFPGNCGVDDGGGGDVDDEKYLDLCCLSASDLEFHIHCRSASAQHPRWSSAGRLLMLLLLLLLLSSSDQQRYLGGDGGGRPLWGAVSPLLRGDAWGHRGGGRFLLLCYFYYFY